MADRPDISVWIHRLEQSPLPARRASPDLLRQLQQCVKRPVDRVVCIATDADPAVDLQREVMRTHRADVLAGLDLLSKLLPVKQYLVDERAARKVDSRYPNLDPTLLIRRLLHRRLRYGAASTDVGVLLLDAITAAQLGRRARGEDIGPLPVVIDDLGSQRRVRLWAPAGTSVREVLAQSQIEIGERVIREGPLMQERTVALDVPVGRTELWLHLVKPVAEKHPESCLRCGECVVACPARIHPAALLEASQRADPSMGERFGLQSCIECGLCTHVCPSSLPVLASIRQLKRLPA